MYVKFGYTKTYKLLEENSNYIYAKCSIDVDPH